MKEYRVNLESYNGPLDLLLYLIRREEVDIYDIPISLITQQYVQYVEMIHDLDPNLAGEFLVMAASLMEIKTRMLLPAAPAEEGSRREESIDPRGELVRQLLEYKAFKDAAGDLVDAAVTRAQKFPRKPFLPEVQPGETDLEDVQLWDLLDAFSKIMTSIGKTPGTHDVIYDDTPVELHAADILDRLQREGGLTFRKVFEGRQLRSEIVGLFIAMLELVRQKKIMAVQEDSFGEIRIQLNPNPPTDDAEIDTGNAAQEFLAGDQTRVDQGQYVADSPPRDPDADDDAEDDAQSDAAEDASADATSDSAIGLEDLPDAPDTTLPHEDPPPSDPKDNA